jgi:hypothetical protein
MTFWDKQLNVPIRETRESQALHVVVKSLVMLAIKIKYARILRYQTIFGEFEITNNINKTNIVDIYHEDKQKKKVICYEVQRVLNEDYYKEKKNFYSDYEQYGFKSIDYVVIDLNKAPSDIKDLWEWINKQIV